jgi:hypothetical protein
MRNLRHQGDLAPGLLSIADPQIINARREADHLSWLVSGGGG